MGQTIRLDSQTVTIVGVLPQDFRWVEKCDVMEPMGVWATHNESATDRGYRGDGLVVGRLAAGVRMEQARAEMETLAAGLARAYPEANDQFGVNLRPLREAFSGEVRPAMLVLLGAAIFVLLVACANVANLFLMRGAVRAKEMALRIAIGASRGRIIRQILTESFLVALLGGVAGVCLAIAGIPAIARLIPPDTLAGASVGMNGAVLLFSAALVVLSMFVSGLAPALHATERQCARGVEGGRQDYQRRCAESFARFTGHQRSGAGDGSANGRRADDEKPVSIASGGFRLPVRARAEDGDGPADRAIRQGPGGDRVLAANAGPRPRAARRGICGGRDRDSAHRQPRPHRHYSGGDGLAEAGQFPASGHPHRQSGL